MIYNDCRANKFFNSSFPAWCRKEDAVEKCAGPSRSVSVLHAGLGTVKKTCTRFFYGRIHRRVRRFISHSKMLKKNIKEIKNSKVLFHLWETSLNVVCFVYITIKISADLLKRFITYFLHIHISFPLWCVP